MTSFKTINCRYLVASLVLIGTANAETQSDIATLFIKAPEVNANKKIFNLEAYKTLECPLNKKLNASHPDYLGRLHYQVAKGNEVIQRKINVSVDSPIMLSATFATVDINKHSDICYYQSHSFWPQAGNAYEIQFLEDCTVIALRTDTEGKKTEVKMNNLIDSCFSQAKE